MRRWRSRLQESMFVRPAAALVLGLILGILLPALDRTWNLLYYAKLQSWMSVYVEGTPGGTRDVLGATVGALATILAVAFSMTTVTVQLAASQYTSRLLQRFMKDRTTQWVLGVFIGTITYLVFVLRAVRSPTGQLDGFVPLVSFLLGLLLAMVCLMLLAFFLHHTTDLIQAASIIMRVGKETIAALREMRLDPVETVPAIDLELHAEPTIVYSRRTGYVQVIDEEEILDLLPEGTRLVRVEARTGDFLLPGIPLLSVWPRQELPRKLERRLQRTFAVGRQRTTEEDVLYGVRQLVDVALKALSPAVNDVTTALMVVNELGAVARAVADKRSLGEGWRVRERNGAVLLIHTFGMLPFLEEAYSELPRASRDNPRVAARILESLSQVARHTDQLELREALRRMGERVIEVMRRAQLDPHDQLTIDERWEGLEQAVRRNEPEIGEPEEIH